MINNNIDDNNDIYISKKIKCYDKLHCLITYPGVEDLDLTTVLLTTG
jgi:hypothetical protein